MAAIPLNGRKERVCVCCGGDSCIGKKNPTIIYHLYAQEQVQLSLNE